MTGVEILATEEVAIEFGFYWLGFWALIGVGILWGTINYFLHLGDKSGQIILIVISFIAGFAGALVVGFNSNDRPATKYETQYKVTISDEVSMNDFLERYEIIDQEGKIYTVRERND